MVNSPVLKQPQKIVIHTIPDVSGSGRCKPYVEIINGVTFEVLWANKTSMYLKSYQIYEGAEHQKRQKMTIEINSGEKFSSDLYFRIKHKGSFKNKLICRLAINPAFIDEKK